ncbi:hypothetical protein QBC45DRAFT_152741 [Copromyces sp. CBS 386.78]|nr:hypothetical protein QBC45DRAFT_152741 [Copromyces sp. CBS 386.78]
MTSAPRVQARLDRIGSEEAKPSQLHRHRHSDQSNVHVGAKGFLQLVNGSKPTGPDKKASELFEGHVCSGLVVINPSTRTLTRRCMACCLGFCALTAIQDASSGGKGGIVALHTDLDSSRHRDANRFPPRNGVRQVHYYDLCNSYSVHRTEIRSLSRAFCTFAAGPTVRIGYKTREVENNTIVTLFVIITEHHHLPHTSLST